MDKQTIFTKAATHLLKQQAKSTRPDGHSCLYRSSDGLMCAVGCLIPDEMYHPLMEGSGVLGLIRNFPIIKELFDDNVVTSDLLYGLQKIHDEYPVEHWEEALRSLAKNNKLKFEVDIATV